MNRTLVVVSVVVKVMADPLVSWRPAGVELTGQTSSQFRPSRAERDPDVMGCDNSRKEVLVAEKQKTEIDARLLEELRRRAREQSRTEGELLEEIVRSYLVLAPRRSESLGAFFENLERRRREEGVEPLSEEEAISLANEELHAMRRERRETR